MNLRQFAVSGKVIALRPHTVATKSGAPAQSSTRQVGSSRPTSPLAPLNFPAIEEGSAEALGPVSVTEGPSQLP